MSGDDAAGLVDAFDWLSNATVPAFDDGADIETLVKVAASFAKPTPRIAIEAWVAGRFPHYVTDPLIPIDRHLPDGSREAVLGFVVDGVLYVHPDREPMVKAAIERVTLPFALETAAGRLRAALPGATVHARHDTGQVVVTLTVEAAVGLAGRLEK